MNDGWLKGQRKVVRRQKMAQLLHQPFVKRLQSPFNKTGLLFLLIHFEILIQLTVRIFKICQWLDSNCGPQVSKAIDLPTEPQPFSTIPFLSSLLWVKNRPHRFLNPRAQGRLCYAYHWKIRHWQTILPELSFNLA